MASNAQGSAAAAGSEERPQAGPLPRKQGEIGYTEEEQGRQEEEQQESAQLPARHPADHDHPQVDDTTTSTTNPPGPSSLPSAPNGASLPDGSSTHSSDKPSFISRLRPGKKLGGLHPSSLFLCLIQILMICGTVVGWVFVAMTVNKRSKTQDDSGSNSPNQNAFNASIFIHVAFAVVTLSELLFLERCIFRLRAERYMHLHPGAALPRSMHLVSSSNNSRLAFAPWNRPPLPTYAAALAETGVGTGDVEDNAIAVPPPPPYGNTRGSMLLLSGYMRNSLRAQVREGHRGSQMTETSDRPVSYMSHDSEWEVVLDADRAMRLEQTLSRLDLGQGRNEPPANAHDHATG